MFSEEIVTEVNYQDPTSCRASVGQEMRSDDNHFGAANRCTVKGVGVKKYTLEGITFHE